MKLLIISILSTLVSLVPNNDEIKYTSVEENQETSLSESMARGKVIYEEFCVRCHKATGEGKAKFYPPLAGSDWLINNRTESIQAVKYGLKGLITVNGLEYKRSMANPGLENHEIADVMNYIMNSWGNTQDKIVSVEEIDVVEERK